MTNTEAPTTTESATGEQVRVITEPRFAYTIMTGKRSKFQYGWNGHLFYLVRGELVAVVKP